MSNYTKTTDFAAKDSLASGNPAKVIKGSEHDTEYNNIATAVSSKADLDSPTLTGTPVAPTAANGTNTTQLATTAYVLANNFPVATRMPFAQAAAPTGWTRDTSDNANNRMLRVVSSGGGGVAGSHSPILNNVVPSHTHGFSTGGVSSDHAHGVNDPGHSHTGSVIGAFNAAQFQGLEDGGNAPNYQIVGSTGVSGTGIWLNGISANHTHSGSTDNGSSQTNWTPRYIDMIICAKD
jgi:hypothetical protein